MRKSAQPRALTDGNKSECRKSNTEIAEPHLARLCDNDVKPSCTKSKADKEKPKQLTPNRKDAKSD